ncbi:MAG TPA: HesA/MoeB/ThiF family protein [Spirochaetia bacterium]|nr:HesA/MoeB/ThiF family protein [Spirochaetaceae bacterium]HPE88217.1 HesA/MoeB/ThiF family protein [Spirochaetales bacterium]HRW23762.1 HesA/MoeB/ThiF family protein [Spirochaetia bacterium]
MEGSSRYGRQIAFKGVGEDGQARLSRARAAVIGVGALGTAIANSLARAGFGFVRLVDPDRVELGNLQRQALFDEDDAAAGSFKAEAAAARLARINSTVVLEPLVARVDASNVDAVIGDVDLVLDGTDNFESRYLINDACRRRRLPWVYGGVLGDSGVSMNVLPDGPCLRCLMPEAPEPGSYETTAEAGVLNQITAIIASIESAEAMKIVIGSPRVRRTLASISLWDASFHLVEVARDPSCPLCGPSANVRR